MNLSEFIGYTKKADEIMIKALADTGFSILGANTLFSHVLSAQYIWAMRILGEKPIYAVWETFKPEEFYSIHKANLALLEDILINRELTMVVSYGNSAGKQFNNTVEDILMHVCNHGTYHRAQLATMLRQAGHKPPVTDYIMLKRQGLIPPTPKGEL